MIPIRRIANGPQSDDTDGRRLEGWRRGDTGRLVDPPKGDHSEGVGRHNCSTREIPSELDAHMPASQPAGRTPGRCNSTSARTRCVWEQIHVRGMMVGGVRPTLQSAFEPRARRVGVPIRRRPARAVAAVTSGRVVAP